jgi:predicted nucleic acid-binding protein
MTVRFADTNVLLYSVSKDPAESEKSERAREILAHRNLRLSTQVLQEFYVQSTRPSRPDPLTHRQASELVESLLRFFVQDTTSTLVLAAMTTSARFRISYWDAAIIEAARVAGADVVLSEDLNDGQDFGGIQIVNPFR